jgi:hypothetical protein
MIASESTDVAGEAAQRDALVGLLPQLVADLFPKPPPTECALCDAVWDFTRDRPFVFVQGQRVCGPCGDALRRPDPWLVRLARWFTR